MCRARIRSATTARRMRTLSRTRAYVARAASHGCARSLTRANRSFLRSAKTGDLGLVTVSRRLIRDINARALYGYTSSSVIIRICGLSPRIECSRTASKNEMDRQIEKN